MAVDLVSVKETWPEGAGGDWDMDISSDGSVSVTRTWVVIFDPIAGDGAAEANERKYAAYTADATALIPPSDAIPSLGSRLGAFGVPLLYNCYLQNIKVDPQDLYVFLVTCTFSNSSSDWIEFEDDPWDGPWLMSFPSKTEKRIVPESVLTPTQGVDLTTKVAVPAGSDFATAADEFYDPVPQENFYPIVIALRKSFQNLPSFRALVNDYLALRGTINDATQTISDVVCTQHYARMSSLSINPAYWKGDTYWNMDLTIQVNSLPWYRTYNHKGTYYLNTDIPPKKVYNVDKAQRRDATKEWLDVDGLGFNYGVSKNYRVFGAINAADWSILSLPTALPST